MRATKSAGQRPGSHLLAGDEPGVYRFRVFYLQINGRRSVVRDRQLYETMRALKLLPMYSKLTKLDEYGSLDYNGTVHGTPVSVSAVAGTWQVRLGPRRSAEAA